MPRVVALEICAHMDNVTTLTIGGDYQFFMKFSCAKCNTETEREMAFNLQKDVPILGGRAKVNLWFKCKECHRHCHVSIVDDSLRAYTIEDDYTYKTLIELDCRGCTPTTFVPLRPFHCIAARSGTHFTDVDLSEDGSWADYDECIKQAVGIFDFRYRFSNYNKHDEDGGDDRERSSSSTIIATCCPLGNNNNNNNNCVSSSTRSSGNGHKNGQHNDKNNNNNHHHNNHHNNHHHNNQHHQNNHHHNHHQQYHNNNHHHNHGDDHYHHD